METSNVKRAVISIIAVAGALVASLGSALAYQDYMQHKSNEFGSTGLKYEVRLVEDFEEVYDWRLGEQIKKEISVANHGQSANGYEEVFVRIQLKEYMEIAPLTKTQTDRRYMIGANGEFIIYSTLDQVQAAVAAGGPYAGHSYASLTDAVTGKSGYFIETLDHDKNGQMGKYVVTSYSVGAGQKVILSQGAPNRASGTNHNSHPSQECNYAIHMWNGTELETREYIDWALNDADIITLSNWDAAGNPAVAKWIVDDLSGSGWAYWGQAIQPDGDSTALFMKEVELIKKPEGSFYYVIHTDMQAVSYDDLGEWGSIGRKFSPGAP